MRRSTINSIARYILLSVLVAARLAASPAFAPPARTVPAAGPRLVAIGDIHGDFDAFVGILQRTGLIDAQLKWTGQDATLVQTGDMIDRGPKSRAVMDLLMSLQSAAPRTSGRVIVLMGNHEAMNLCGDWKYVVREDYAAFTDGESEHRQKTAYAAARQLNRKPADEMSWMAEHPLGFLERAQAFGPDGKYGKWLRSLPAAAIVDDTVFVHGGLTPDIASKGIAHINDAVRNEIQVFDRARRFLVARHTALAFDSLTDLVHAASDASASAEPAVQEFRRYDDWLSVRDDGPLWLREYARWTDAEGEPLITAVLAHLKAARIVVGHTVQAGRVLARWNGRAYVIDTGMFSAYFPNGRASALVVQGGAVTVQYGDGKPAP